MSAGNWFCFQAILTQALVIIFPVPPAGFLVLLTAPLLTSSSLLPSLPAVAPLLLTSCCCCLSCSAVEGALQTGHPCLDMPHRDARGSFPLITRHKNNYLIPIAVVYSSNSCLFGGMHWPPKTIFGGVV